MTRKGSFLFWTDVLNTLLTLALLVTGVVMRWVLPPGTGGGYGLGHGAGRGGGSGGKTLLDLTRHQWGDVHFWIAAALLAGILLHLALHWGWIKTSTIQTLAWRARKRITSPSPRPAAAASMSS